SIWFDADALARLSREDAQQLEALPIRVEGDRVMVAVAEPTEQRLAELRRVIGDNTIVVVVPKTALDAGIRSELLTSRGTASGDAHRKRSGRGCRCTPRGCGRGRARSAGAQRLRLDRRTGRRDQGVRAAHRAARGGAGREPGVAAGDEDAARRCSAAARR